MSRPVLAQLNLQALKENLQIVRRAAPGARVWSVVKANAYGHGTLGWTMACGSGQLLSDLISGRTPAIPFDDLSAARYQSGFTPSRPQHLHGAHN